MFSQTALKIYALKKERIVKSNAHFWREFNDIDKIDLWTKASKNRVKSIFKFCGLDKLFKKIILDNKTSFRTSIKRLKALTHSDMFVVYENDDKFFDGE